MHFHTAWGQLVVKVLQCTTTLPGGNVQEAPIVPRNIALGQGVVEFLRMPLHTAWAIVL